MREVAIVAYSRSPMIQEARGLNEVEMLIPVLQDALDQVELNTAAIDFICSGSCDYVAGGAFSFVMAVDALGITPCKQESHVEMDAAWALYEAWLKFQCGEISTALIYGFGKPSNGNWPRILSQQLDPYYIAPLWPDLDALSGLQAQMMIESGRWSEADFAEVVSSGRAKAAKRTASLPLPEESAAELLRKPYYAEPLRAHDPAPLADGASVLILADKEQALKLTDKPAWIRGLDHRMDIHQFGLRDWLSVNSAKMAAKALKLDTDSLDIAELFAPYSHQQLLLEDSLGLGGHTQINPSGGLQGGHIVMAGGLDRFGEVFRELGSSGAKTALAHAGSGPLLQHNLLGILESSHG